MREICNHPCLAAEGGAGDGVPAAADSSKLECCLEVARAVVAKGDAVVVVSNFKRVLDVVDAAARAALGPGCRILRIDGDTPVERRQQQVDALNCGHGDVFLLSAKAGGAGLNLVGANHLVLFDSDWNPATDAQAMARVWREGQAKPVSIYRLLATGTIDERVYQRQLLKTDLTAAVQAGAKKRRTGGGQFSQKELRDLFSLNLATDCDTVDKLRREGGLAAGGPAAEASWANRVGGLGPDSALFGARHLVSFLRVL